MRISRSSRKCVPVPSVRVVLWAVALVCAAVTVRAQGIPGDYLLSGKWRAVGTENSPLTNPALLVERAWLQAQWTGSSLNGDYLMQDLGLSVPLTVNQTFGFSWLYQSAGEYSERSFDEAALSEQVLGTMEDKSSVFTFTYAISPFKLLALGANVNIVYQRFGEERETGYGVDAGMTLRLPERRVIGRHIIGVGMQNMVAPVVGTAFARTLNFTWAGSYAKRYVNSTINFQLKDIGTSDGETTGDASPWALDAKLGVWPFKIAKAYGLLGFNNGGFDYYGAAIGVNVPVLNRDRDLEAVYQYVGMKDGLAMHSIYVQGEFGWNKDDLHARLEERRRNALPRQLYERALTLFDEGKYWEAYFTFTRIKADHPRFPRLDGVDFYSARCLEELDMRHASGVAFELTRRTYPGSRFVPEIDLGIVRTSYRNSDIRSLERAYRSLQLEPGADSLADHARYLMGQLCVASRDHARGKAILDSIPSTHPDYAFAQFTAALADLELGWPREMERRLMAVAVVQQTTPEIREIVAKANLKLGLLYLEMFTDDPQSLAKAVTALRRVPVESRSYADALTGLAWAALGAHNWADCETIGRSLLAVRDADPRVRAEGALAAGYALLFRKEFIAALDVLEEGVALIDKAPKTDAGDIRTLRERYEEIGRSAVGLAFQKESDDRLDAIATLRRRQLDAAAQIAQIQTRIDNASREKALGQRLDGLKTDLQFMLAEATQRAASERAEEYRARMQKKSLQYDQQIQQLKDQMKEMK